MSARWWTEEEDAFVRADPDDSVVALQVARTPYAVKQRRWKLASGDVRYGGPTGRPANALEDVWRWIARGADDECWLWQGAFRGRGYGAFALNRKTLPAHRAAFHAATGIDPAGLLVCHSCDNPSCCNPAHLFLGTHTDNVRDMLAKGRARPPRGEAHHAAKLTVAQVRTIRRRRAAGEKLIDLAREYDVCDGRLSSLCRHPEKNWSHA